MWHVDGHGHDPAHWSSSLYWFSQSVFQDKKPVVKQTSSDKPSTPVPSATLAGKWTATIDTQIGKQAYVYTVESKDDKLLGSASMKLDGNDWRRYLWQSAQIMFAGSKEIEHPKESVAE